VLYVERPFNEHGTTIPTEVWPETTIILKREDPEGEEDNQDWYHVFQTRHFILAGDQIVLSDGGVDRHSYELGFVPLQVLKSLSDGFPEDYVDEHVGTFESVTQPLHHGVGIGFDVSLETSLMLHEERAVAAPGRPAENPFVLLLLCKSLFSHKDLGPAKRNGIRSISSDLSGAGTSATFSL